MYVELLINYSTSLEIELSYVRFTSQLLTKHPCEYYALYSKGIFCKQLFQY